MQEGSKEYVVKGDWPCLPRTVAAHTGGDEDEGPRLGRMLNTHESQYRGIYEEKIDKEFTLSVTVGVSGETKQIENRQQDFDWLLESESGAYMWRSCVDVIATCNMAHIEIDIIILDRGFNPEIRSFKPDPEFP